MLCTFQHPPGAEARSFIASREVTLDPGASADPAGLTARARPEAGPEARAANLRSDRGTCQDDRAEQRLIGLGRNCQPKQADTPRSQF